MKAWWAGILVVMACKSNAPTPPAPVASAGPPAGPASVASAPATDIVDAAASAAEPEGEAGVEAASAGAPLPPLADGAVWSVVRWTMRKSDVEQAFRSHGVTPASAKGRTIVKHAAWQGVIDFNADKPTQIVVTGSRLTKEAAEAIAAKIRERGGAPSRSTERTEHRFRQAGSVVSVVVAGGGGSWSVREEHVREGGKGAVAFAKLSWAMKPEVAAAALKAAGFTAHATKASAAGLDQKAPSVTFTKGEQEGTASFGDDGLIQVVVSGPLADKASAAARVKELEAALGAPTSVESSAKTSHEDGASRIELEVRERRPAGTFTVVESYRPKK